MAMDITQTVERVHSNIKSQGFWDKERNVGEALMLIVSELGEAVEAHRKNRFGYDQKNTFEDELADVIIRVFDLCGGLNIDIERQLEWKIEHNKTRNLENENKRY